MTALPNLDQINYIKLDSGGIFGPIFFPVASHLVSNIIMQIANLYDKYIRLS